MLGKPKLTNIDNNSVEIMTFNQSSDDEKQVPRQLETELASDNYDSVSQGDRQSTPLEVEPIPLLEEKLLITRRRQKVGEVIVRKRVETRIAKVPIKREVLVVERIGKNPEQLTEVVISENQLNGFKYEELNNNECLYITQSNYLNLQTVRQLLEALANLSSAANAKIRLEIVTNSCEHQTEHQNVCDRYL